MNEQTFELTPDSGFQRKLHIVLGILAMFNAAMGLYAFKPGRWIHNSSTVIWFLNGAVWILGGVFYSRIHKAGIMWNSDRLKYHRGWRKRAFGLPDITGIKLVRMQLEIHLQDDKPFKMTFSDYTYAQNAEVKGPLYAFLREQAKQRDIPITET